MPAAIEEVKSHAQSAPYPKPLPSHRGKIVHDVATADDRKASYQINCRAAEGSVGSRIFSAQHHHRHGRHQKSKEGAHTAHLSNYIDGRETTDNSHRQPHHDGDAMRSLEAGMHLADEFWTGGR